MPWKLSDVEARHPVFQRKNGYLIYHKSQVTPELVSSLQDFMVSLKGKQEEFIIEGKLTATENGLKFMLLDAHGGSRTFCAFAPAFDWLWVRDAPANATAV